MKKISLLLAFMLLSACSAPMEAPADINTTETTETIENTGTTEETQHIEAGGGLSFSLPQGEIFTKGSEASESDPEAINSHEYTNLDPEKFAEHKGQLVNGAYVVESYHTFTGEDAMFDCESFLQNITTEETPFGKVFYGEYPSIPRGKAICKADESSKYLVIVKEEAGQTLVWDLVKKTLFQE